MSNNKQNFALDVSALSVYTDQIGNGLAKEMLLNANTIKGNIVSVQYGAVGDKVALNVVKSTMYGVTSACGQFTDTGSTVLAQSLVQMCPIKFSQEICLDTLNKYYYSYFMEKKYNTESLGDFADVFYANKVEATALEVDKILWRGAQDSNPYAVVTGNLTLCSGFLQVAYDNSASTINVVKSAITKSNGYNIVDDLLTSVAANAPVLLENANLYLSPADFQAYAQSLRSLNLFHYDITTANQVSEILHPGSIGLKVIKTNGLAGATSGTGLITSKENIWAVLSDESDLSFKSWYSNDFDALRLMAKLKIGVGFYQPELVIRIA